MINLITKIDNGLEKLERFLAVGLMCSLIGLICINILTRNILHWTSHRLIEISPTVVLWLALVGATMALKSQRHIKIELLVRFLPSYGQRMAVILTSLYAIAICGLLLVSSVSFVRNEIVIFGAQGWAAVCFPLFFAVALFRFGLRLLTFRGATRENKT